MRTAGPWSGSSRRLTLLFLTVLVPPAVTLGWLGILLLEQDRNLWKQRDLERRQTTSDAVARSLEQMLSQAERWPGSQPVPEGALRVVISSEEVHIDPAGRALWLPALPPTPTASAREFADSEKLEFQGAADRALVRYEELARARQPAVRAGALLRIGRVYRSSGRISEALQAYRDLSTISGVAIDDVPADLQARRAICALLGNPGEGPISLAKRRRFNPISLPAIGCSTVRVGRSQKVRSPDGRGAQCPSRSNVKRSPKPSIGYGRNLVAWIHRAAGL